MFFFVVFVFQNGEQETVVQLNKYYFINLFSSLSALTFQISWAVTVNTFEWSEHLRVLLDTAVSCGRKFLLQKWLQCRSLVNWVYPLVVFGSNWPGEDFIFPENTSKRYRIGLKLTDFVHTRYKYFSEFIISFFRVSFNLLTLLVFPVKNDRTPNNCLWISHFAILSPNIGFILFVNLFSFI